MEDGGSVGLKLLGTPDHGPQFPPSRNAARGECDEIANATALLPMFDEYNIDEEKHSSSDGQRIETQIPTINARHSSKYFGLKKGVSA